MKGSHKSADIQVKLFKIANMNILNDLKLWIEDSMVIGTLLLI
jgi:hypothetical protein